jgi:hypothetical protein
MPETATVTGDMILQYQNKIVRLFLRSGITLTGRLLAYVHDPIEQEGCITLDSDKPGEPPSIIFRSQVTQLQPVLTGNREGKHGPAKDRQPRPRPALSGQ